MRAPRPAPRSTRTSIPVAWSLPSASGTRATRRSPGAVSLATPIFIGSRSLSKSMRGILASTSLVPGASPMIPVARLNHAVLYVRDAGVAADFYGRVFGFETVSSEMGGRAVFMRAANGENHHDLGLFSVGPAAPHPSRGSTGLYHLAWEVPTIEDLATAAR